ncbi:hypothetical protein C0J52_01052 [Blattella germanica]|nr:hypothetical protein C0J52_01052 [Blattella germanica]
MEIVPEISHSLSNILNSNSSELATQNVALHNLISGTKGPISRSVGLSAENPTPLSCVEESTDMCRSLKTLQLLSAADMPMPLSIDICSESASLLSMFNMRSPALRIEDVH